MRHSNCDPNPVARWIVPIAQQDPRALHPARRFRPLTRDRLKLCLFHIRNRKLNHLPSRCMIPIRCVEPTRFHHIWGCRGNRPQLVGFTGSMHRSDLSEQEPASLVKTSAASTPQWMAPPALGRHPRPDLGPAYRAHHAMLISRRFGLREFICRGGKLPDSGGTTGVSVRRFPAGQAGRGAAAGSPGRPNEPCPAGYPRVSDPQPFGRASWCRCHASGDHGRRLAGCGRGGEQPLGPTFQPAPRAGCRPGTGKLHSDTARTRLSLSAGGRTVGSPDCGSSRDGRSRRRQL